MNPKVDKSIHITIGSHEFKTYSEAKEFIKNLFNKYSIGDTVSKEDCEFFIAGIKMRKDCGVEKIGCGMKGIFISENKYGGKTTMIERVDGTQTDFGIYKHLERKTKKIKIGEKEINFKKACRTAIVEDKKKLKFETNHYGDVHHDQETFNQIVLNFIEEYNIDVDNVEIGGHGDGDIEVYFIDKDIESLWVGYHRKNATLKVLSKEDHKKEHRASE